MFDDHIVPLETCLMKPVETPTKHTQIQSNQYGYIKNNWKPAKTRETIWTQEQDSNSRRLAVIEKNRPIQD